MKHEPYPILPGYDEGPCDVCGRPIDLCICPECPTCHAHGDPACYDGGTAGFDFATNRPIKYPSHNMTRSAFQIAGRQTLDAQIRREIKEMADKVEADFVEWLSRQP